jgi:hypothetical protein
MIDLDAIRSALGHLKPDTDPRLDRPLHEQIAALLRFGTDEQLKPRRSIPVAWDDTDTLVCNVAAKLVAEVDRLTAERDALLWFLERAGEALESAGQALEAGDAKAREAVGSPTIPLDEARAEARKLLEQEAAR